jgi:lipoate-protein ligase A
MVMFDLPSWNPSWCETELDERWFARLEALEFDVIWSEPRSANENLALDTVLFNRVASGRRRPLFWMWEWSEPAVVLGSFQSVRNEIDIEAAVRYDTRVVRRVSGGGAMLVEPERTITYSLIIPDRVVADMSCVQSFAMLDRWIILTLRALGIPATYHPVNEISSPYAKIGGAAQFRRARTVLHHASLAYEMDDERLFSILRLGRRRIIPRGIPSAVKKVSPLTQFTTLSFHDVQSRLFDSFSSQYRTNVSSFEPDELEEASARMNDVYFNYRWVYRIP